MLRLGLFISVTLIAVYALLAVYGSGTRRVAAPAQPATRAAEDPGAPSLLPKLPTEPESIGADGPPPADLVRVSTQTPEQTQRFPGPPLKPSPEYGDRTPNSPAGPVSDGGPVLYVTGSRVNFRAGPSTGEPVIGALSSGAAVEALGPTDSPWVNIRDAQGRVGYMSGQFLSRETPG